MSTPNTKHHALTIRGLGKCFGVRRICRDVTLELATGQSLAIVGPNGSGKSTMIKMIAGLIRPDTGRVEHRRDGIAVRSDGWHRHLGLVSPDLALYEELTGLENLDFANEVGGWGRPRRDFDALLDEFGLGGRGHDRVADYSSGMKQRLKFAAALLKEPAVLLLDEPTITLDEEGSARVWAVVSSRPMILIIATNDPQEASRAGRRLTMGEASGGSGRA
ncbi:MAG: ABC transporter ATP-binding protein [candidate division Zixibacteria bacterium]|nr:ABC transporter ATP-binding protein [candidate division Zixibacteria bacterium]